jgi:putative mRNA 3-end processing factor
MRRLGEPTLLAMAQDDALRLGATTVSLHPAGHILGSAKVRLEHRGEVCAASSDYKIESDRTCATFDPVRCDVFITESTFGLPIIRWRPQAHVVEEIEAWWRDNIASGRTGKRGRTISMEMLNASVACRSLLNGRRPMKTSFGALPDPRLI